MVSPSLSEHLIHGKTTWYTLMSTRNTRQYIGCQINLFIFFKYQIITYTNLVPLMFIKEFQPFTVFPFHSMIKALYLLFFMNIDSRRRAHSCVLFRFLFRFRSSYINKQRGFQWVNLLLDIIADYRLVVLFIRVDHRTYRFQHTSYTLNYTPHRIFENIETALQYTRVLLRVLRSSFVALILGVRCPPFATEWNKCLWIRGNSKLNWGQNLRFKWNFRTRDSRSTEDFHVLFID